MSEYKYITKNINYTQIQLQTIMITITIHFQFLWYISKDLRQ